MWEKQRWKKHRRTNANRAVTTSGCGDCTIQPAKVRGEKPEIPKTSQQVSSRVQEMRSREVESHKDFIPGGCSQGIHQSCEGLYEMIPKRIYIQSYISYV